MGWRGVKAGDLAVCGAEAGLQLTAEICTLRSKGDRVDTGAHRTACIASSFKAVQVWSRQADTGLHTCAMFRHDSTPNDAVTVTTTGLLDGYHRRRRQAGSLEFRLTGVDASDDLRTALIGGERICKGRIVGAEGVTGGVPCR